MDKWHHSALEKCAVSGKRIASRRSNRYAHAQFPMTIHGHNHECSLCATRGAAERRSGGAAERRSGGAAERQHVLWRSAKREFQFPRCRASHVTAMKALRFLAVLLLTPCLAHAELRWKEKRLEFHPASSDTEVKAEFNFSNAGQTAVTIDSIKPGCDCTTAALDKKTYQPGEKGRITATFIIGERRGLQDKPIRVTIQGEKEPTVLSMVTHIPDLVKLSPSFVFWRIGEESQAKAIEVTLPPESKMRVTKVTSSDPKMTAKVETVQEGAAYKIVVTPSDTSAPVAAILWIECASPSGVPKSFTAYAHIKRAANASQPAPTLDGKETVSAAAAK